MNASVVRRRPPPPGPTSESARRDGSEGDPGAKGGGAARRRRRNAHNGKPLGFGFGEGPRAGRSGLAAAAAAAALFVLAASRLARRGRASFGGGIDASDRRRIGSLRGRPSERAAAAAATSVLRISSSDRANVTRFFPCVGSVLGPEYVGIRDVLRPHRSRARFAPKRYDALPCAPALCFRGVYDGFDDLLTDDRRSAKIRLLMESLIRNPKVPLSESILRTKTENRSSLIKESASRRKTYRADRKARDFDELHADYFESPKYVYTAILYDDPSGDLRGGETALVDWAEDASPAGAGGRAFGLRNATETAARGGSANHEEEATVRLTHGTVVEPKRGRIVLFSSGGENFHAPLPVRRGRRPTHHVWFECEG